MRHSPFCYSNSEARQEIGELSFIEILVELMREGNLKNKECEASVVLEFCSCNSSLTLATLQFRV
ncbi:hypothetical protein JHK87_015948 [Glycine soja]|nr:hypothetical protein JHK87_015948 [Glycine soja]